MEQRGWSGWSAWRSVPDIDRGASLVPLEDELALVRLPAQTFENGQHVTISAKLLQSAPPFQKVGT